MEQFVTHFRISKPLWCQRVRVRVFDVNFCDVTETNKDVYWLRQCTKYVQINRPPDMIAAWLEHIP